ncbi:unnamed protein product, partial [Polarella glacialis]
EANSATNALLFSSAPAVESGGSSSSTCCDRRKDTANAESLPEGYVLIFTQVLPDGLGDLIFGENAVSELLSLGPVAWVRCHVSEEQVESGERLVKDVAARLSFNLT